MKPSFVSSHTHYNVHENYHVSPRDYHSCRIHFIEDTIVDFGEQQVIFCGGQHIWFPLNIMENSEIILVSGDWMLYESKALETSDNYEIDVNTAVGIQKMEIKNGIITIRPGVAS